MCLLGGFRLGERLADPDADGDSDRETATPGQAGDERSAPPGRAWHSRRVVACAASEGVERRVGDECGLRLRSALRQGIDEERPCPVVRACVQVGELLEAEGRSDAPPQLGDHEVDLLVETGIPWSVVARSFDSAAAVVPLLSHELEFHAGRW